MRKGEIIGEELELGNSPGLEAFSCIHNLASPHFTDSDSLELTKLPFYR